MIVPVDPASRIAFLGPAGTFTEEAVRSQPDLAAATLVQRRSFTDVLAAVESGAADYGFVAIENSIEGSVNAALDQLIFERDLYIVREVVLPVTQNLLVTPGTKLESVRRVVSFPVATAQCRAWLGKHLPDVEEVASTSTAEAVHEVAEAKDKTTAAIGTALAASLYGLEVLAAEIEDNADNVTRFALVAEADKGIPPATGHDKTSIVCYQSTDRPGSLHHILGQFSARDINLVKLESRPTKTALGDYCFVIDMVGHVADEVVSDTLRDLHATLRHLKFLGSYPAAGDDAHELRVEASERWHAADEWIRSVQQQVR